MHPGICGFEIIDLQGVDTVTGNKKVDRFGAIFRLIDYLNHHQTFTFLILDNENYAQMLKERAKKEKSRHGFRRYTTRSEYIRIWRISFEFDNFFCTEIAAALTLLASGVAEFSVSEVMNAKRDSNLGSALKSVYKKKANYGLQKTKLAQVLAEKMMYTTDNQEIEKRPIIKILNQIELLAVHNHLPTTQSIRDANQTSTLFDK